MAITDEEVIKEAERWIDKNPIMCGKFILGYYMSVNDWLDWVAPKRGLQQPLLLESKVKLLKPFVRSYLEECEGKTREEIEQMDKK